MYSIKKRFEHNFTNFIGVKYALAVSSGRNAIYLILKSFVKPGDEVILPKFICKSVISAIKESGAKPIFVDIKEDLTMNEIEIIKKINPKTKAILLVHIYGRSPNIMFIKNICKNKKLILIEDCAQALGSRYNNKIVGSFGDFAIYSLTKNMINSGGGVIVTNNKESINKIFFLKNILNNNTNNISNIIFLIPYFSFKYLSSIYESSGSEVSKYIINLISNIVKLLQNKSSDNKLNFNFDCTKKQINRSFKQLNLIDIELLNREKIYSYLEKNLGKDYKIPPIPFKSNPLNLYLPIIIKDTYLKKKILKKIKVFSTPWECGDNRFPMSNFISNNMIFLPIGQKFNKRRLDFLCKKLIKLKYY